MIHTLPSIWDSLRALAPPALANRRYNNVPDGHARDGHPMVQQHS